MPLSCWSLLPCVAVLFCLLICFLSPSPGLLQVAVPHCEGGGFVRPAVHAAELPALPRGISLGKAGLRLGEGIALSVTVMWGNRGGRQPEVLRYWGIFPSSA